MANRISARLRLEVVERAYDVCEYCLIHEDDTWWGSDIDHIISRKHGGATEPGNLAFACALCNGHKGSDIGTLAGTPRTFTRFFHPRNDKWSAFFILNGAHIEPLNDVAEGTARILHFNDSDAIEERPALVQTGRYPTVNALARMKA